MGFEIDPSETVIDGVPVQRDYDGPGIDRVTFTLHLDYEAALRCRNRSADL
jgi:hypothetical protein